MDSLGLVTMPCSAMASITIACMVDRTYLVTSTTCSVTHTMVVVMMVQQMTDSTDFKT